MKDKDTNNLSQIAVISDIIFKEEGIITFQDQVTCLYLKDCLKLL